MENAEEKILGKKIDDFRSNIHDFQCENELTVEITLSEYRELIKEVSIKEYEINKANNGRYERESENNRLKDRVRELEETIFEYKSHFGKLPEPDTEEED